LQSYAVHFMGQSDLGFTSSLADPDVWLRPAIKCCGFTYYEYIFLYVDNLLVISEHPNIVMKAINDQYRMKEGSIMKPELYLGAQIKEFPAPGSTRACWSISTEKYLKGAYHNVKIDLGKINKRLPNNVPTPLSSGYRLELDVSVPLDDNYVHWYQKLIGIVRWAIELRRIDIHLSVALLAQCLVEPRVGHLDQVFHIFAYLKSHIRSKIVLDAPKPIIDENQFLPADWTEFYPDASEPIPLNAPETRGNDVIISCFIDADHAGNQVMQHSHTGVIIFCNQVPIMWFSK